MLGTEGWAVHISATAFQKGNPGPRESRTFTDHGESPAAGAEVLGQGGGKDEVGWGQLN